MFLKLIYNRTGGNILSACFFINLFCGSLLLNARTDTLKQPPGLYPMWSFYVPGATHFIDGRIGTGLVFSSIELGGVTSGIIFNKTLKEHSESAYYNFPLFLGLNTLAIDKCDFVRRQLEYIKYYKPEFQFDDIAFNKLLLEPFRPKNIFSPITGAFIALAIGELWLESKNADYAIDRISQIHFIDHYMERNPALAVYGAASLAMSYQAGVSEEYYFRNYMMPLLDYKYGQRKGLIITSAAFGSAHAFNYLFVDNPDPLTILYHVGFTTVMGYVLGRSVQKNNYKTGRAIAAHTWYDFTLMLGSFIVNPAENFLGVDVKIKL